MEMQKIPPEKQKNEADEEASEPMLEVKTEAKEESEHYSELKSPTEDVYTEAFFGGPQQKKETGNQSQPNIGLWRAACLSLSIICLILLLIIIVLGLKFQTGSTVCSDGEKTTDSHVESCSIEWCQNNVPQTVIRSRGYLECPKGWWRFDQSCFFLSTYRLSWDESSRNCTNSGGTLTVINNVTVQNFLSKKGSLKYWIGLRDTRSWTWVDNSPLGKSYWSDVPGDGGCAMLNTQNPPNKNWVKAGCQQYTYFTCQLQL